MGSSFMGRGKPAGLASCCPYSAIRFVGLLVVLHTCGHDCKAHILRVLGSNPTLGAASSIELVGGDVPSLMHLPGLV